MSKKMELKFSAATGELSGYASTFGGEPDSYGDVIAPGAFAASIKAHKAAGTMPLMLWGHDASKVPIGVWNEMREDEVGLYVGGRLNLEISAAREVHSSLIAAKGGSLSIGFRTPPGGRTPMGKGVYSLKAVDLVEVSIVNMPANRRARITSVKSQNTLADKIDRATMQIRNLK